MLLESLERVLLFFFNDTATTEIYTLSLHDALPILQYAPDPLRKASDRPALERRPALVCRKTGHTARCSTRSAKRRWSSCRASRSEEHTSELQSRQYLVCRLLLEKKKKHNNPHSLV